MGVLNYTPDSFSDGGRFNAGIDEAVKRIEDMAAAGTFFFCTLVTGPRRSLSLKLPDTLYPKL